MITLFGMHKTIDTHGKIQVESLKNWKNEVKKVKHYKKLKICQIFTEMAGKVEFPGQAIASLPSDVLVSTLQVQVLGDDAHDQGRPLARRQQQVGSGNENNNLFYFIQQSQSSCTSNFIVTDKVGNLQL